MISWSSSTMSKWWNSNWPLQRKKSTESVIQQQQKFSRKKTSSDLACKWTETLIANESANPCTRTLTKRLHNGLRKRVLMELPSPITSSGRKHIYPGRLRPQNTPTESLQRGKTPPMSVLWSTDSIFAEREDSLNKCLGYDTKQSDGAASVNWIVRNRTVLTINCV